MQRHTKSSSQLSLWSHVFCCVAVARLVNHRLPDNPPHHSLDPKMIYRNTKAVSSWGALYCSIWQKIFKRKLWNPSSWVMSHPPGLPNSGKYGPRQCDQSADSWAEHTAISILLVFLGMGPVFLSPWLWYRFEWVTKACALSTDTYLYKYIYICIYIYIYIM